MTAVFLDPPYLMEGRAGGLYGVDADVNPAVRVWCIDNGTNPLLRTALCGYDGDGNGDALKPLGWHEVAWKAAGGYGSQGDGQGRENASRERIWFSPSCLNTKGLFDL